MNTSMISKIWEVFVIAKPRLDKIWNVKAMLYRDVFGKVCKPFK
uniref:Uncharacterized protein n=1 Tax=Anguilla anguilla TaxID=7936 RepID=A0A0E9W784_ANGAN